MQICQQYSQKNYNFIKFIHENLWKLRFLDVFFSVTFKFLF